MGREKLDPPASVEAFWKVVCLAQCNPSHERREAAGTRFVQIVHPSLSSTAEGVKRELKAQKTLTAKQTKQWPPTI